MEKQADKQSLIDVLTAYKENPNPLTTLSMLTTMATANLYAIKQENTAADKTVWLTYDKASGQKELITFTDSDQASAHVNKSGHVSVVELLSFKQIALMVLAKDNPIDSYIVNPETTKAKFNQNIIKKVWQYAIKHV